MIQAVIFDRDGVLVDSEYANLRVADMVSVRLGFSLTDDERKLVIGRHPEDYVDLLQQKYGFNRDEYLALQRELFTKALDESPLFEDAVHLLSDLYAHGLKIAVCTSANREATVRVLDRASVADNVALIVAKGDYTKRKPDPEPYVVTAKKLGVSPKACLVIEDSETGLKAALAAGMVCIVIYNDYTKDHDFTGALEVVSSATKINMDMLLA